MDTEFDIAIVGMAGRFPGARNLDEYWQNLVNGVESIARLTDQDLSASGIDPALLARPDYVKASPILAEPEFFDANFFGLSASEASTMDPQHRLLLELAYTALEDAACNPERFTGRIGVFTGSAMNTYFMSSGLDARFSEEYIPTLTVNDKDFLSTRISYKLGLRGPSLTVQTACSTSLVAIHLARQSLLSEETDVALAGAVSVRVPHRAGYLYDGSGVVSPDGHVRAFDAAANGTVFGSGAGVIVLKRLSDALAQGDRIHAVIKGSAVNNDGSAKAGYTAPSVKGQADVIVEALANAGVDAGDISFVEAHGSGTPVGDPIEVLALTKAFHHFTKRNAYCALGSVKTNVGHLDAAAGMAGLIKTVLALKHRRIPPTLHYSKPNPEIDFPATPFYVNAKAVDWAQASGPRRAGVMSTGMGGTNAHVVLEEAPAAKTPAASDQPQVLVLSARTPSALDTMTGHLADFLASADSTPGLLADVAFTLQHGRKNYPCRRFVVGRTAAEAVAALKAPDQKKNTSELASDKPHRPVIFLLPGVGDHYLGMGRGLYDQFEVFRRELDHCAKILQPLLNADIRELLYPPNQPPRPASEKKGIDLKRMLHRDPNEVRDPAVEKLDQTLHCQPALFSIEYALARLWQHWGIQPERIVGHSMGEYVAACLAGVFSLEDALKLIVARARLVNALPQGAMLAVMLSEAKLLPMLGETLSIALINGPDLCVVAGPVPDMAAFENRLKEQEIIYRPVRNAHAFHSRLLDPIVDAYTKEVKQVRLHAPRIPFTSNVTGTWITDQQAQDPAYWVEHARRTARFSDALAQLWKIPDCLLLEVGPGRTLGMLAMQHPARVSVKNAATLSSVRQDYENQADVDFILNSIGRLWLAGAELDWDKIAAPAGRRKISLPAYPFERQRYWIDEAPRRIKSDVEKSPALKSNVADWFNVPSWNQSLLPLAADALPAGETHWLIIGESSDFADRTVAALKNRGATVTCAWFDKNYSAVKEGVYEIEPACLEDYLKLFSSLKTSLKKALNILHLGSLASQVKSPDAGYDPSVQDFGFYSLLSLAKAIGEENISLPVCLGVVTSQIHEVSGEEKLNPVMATVLGPCGVIPKEYPNITCFSVDLPALPLPAHSLDEMVGRLLAEFREPLKPRVLAYRGKYRWEKDYQSYQIPAVPASVGDEVLRSLGLRPRGVYLITGGTGGIGLVMAKYLAQTCQARLILTKKTPFAPKSIWQQRLASSDTPGAERRILAALLEIEALGGEVDILSCDVSDRAALQSAITETQSKHGTIHGVIHAAGIIGVGLVQVKTKAAADQVFASKVNGSFALQAALKDVKLDFLLLVSSLASVTMPFAHVDYCAAHAFMDAFAPYFQSRTNCRTVTINWPIWREVGILADMKAQTGVEAWRDEALQKGILTRDALDVLQRALRSNVPQLVVTPEDLPAVLKAGWLPPGSPGASAMGGTPALSKTLANRRGLKVEEPQNEVEQAVAEIWSAILGITPIGRNENFLDLGGHSLLAMQIVGRIRTAFEVNFTLRDFFEGLTIAQAAAAIRAKIISEIEGMSDKEVSQLLHSS